MWGRAQFLDDSAGGLRRLMLQLYALTLPPFIITLLVLAEGRARLYGIAAVLVLAAAGALRLALTPEPKQRALILPMGIAPTAACAVAFAATGGQALGFLGAISGPLAIVAVLCDAPVVIAAWATGVAGCFGVALWAYGWTAAVVAALLFGVLQGVVALVVHGKTARHRQARLRSMEKQLNDIELLVRRDGVIVDANDRAAAAYGYAREALVGLHVGAIRLPEDGARLEVQMRVVEEEGGLVFETLHRRRDGSTFPVEVSSRACRIRGEVYLHSVVRDISARHAAEAQRRLLEVLFRHMVEGVVVLDESFRVKLWSPGAEELFGWKAEEVLGRSPFEFLVPEDAEAEFARVIAAAAAGEDLTRVASRRRKDGSEIVTSVSVVAMTDHTGGSAGSCAWPATSPPSRRPPGRCGRARPGSPGPTRPGRRSSAWWPTTCATRWRPSRWPPAGWRPRSTTPIPAPIWPTGAT